jgi:hypothetical protein
VNRPTVFVARPNCLSTTQDRTCRSWLEALGRHARVRSIGRSAYARDSWEPLRDAVLAADGMMVLGFGQLSADQAVWRPGSPDETRGEVRWTSPWLHLEVGLALAADLPILLVREPGVAEGVFATTAPRPNLFGPLDLTALPALPQGWLAAVRGRARAGTDPRGEAAAG